jgi:hypothetical protein
MGTGTGLARTRLASTRLARAGLARYGVAWLYLIGFTVAEFVYAVLSSSHQSAVLQWASTNVVNLHHDPVGSLVASAFFPGGFAATWPVLIALAMFGANRALGNWRTALVCIAGHVIGTLVSEGIVDYRVAHHLLPVSDTRILDVGPSYIVVSAIAVAVLYGSWPARVAAALDFAALVLAGHIFSGLTNLDVAAVGHTTAIIVAVLLGSLLAWQQRRGRDQQPRASASRTIPAASSRPSRAGGSSGGAPEPHSSDRWTKIGRRPRAAAARRSDACAATIPASSGWQSSRRSAVRYTLASGL